MIEHHLREYYQHILVNPVANRLRYFVTPNQITLLSGLLGLLIFPALIMQKEILAISLLLLSGYCDTLDGTLARFNQQKSCWGSILDIMADRLVEFIVVLALWFVAPLDRGLWCILMLGSMLLCVTSFLVVGIFSENQSQKSFNYSPGLMERAEAFAFFIAMIIWPNAFVFLAFLFIILVVFTALVRLRDFYIQQERVGALVD